MEEDHHEEIDPNVTNKELECDHKFEFFRQTNDYTCDDCNKDFDIAEFGKDRNSFSCRQDICQVNICGLCYEKQNCSCAKLPSNFSKHNCLKLNSDHQWMLWYKAL